MAHTLPTLPYAFNALEPHIDALTMEIHSQRHHKAYVDNLNKALEGHTELAAKSIEDLLRSIKSVPENIRQAVINNGGGHHNHSLFWRIMGPNGGGEPSGPLADAINEAFGDFSKMKDTVKQNALTQFGSGWSWVVYDPNTKKLVAVKKPNQDSPLSDGLIPIFGIDVWEHAYYLKYQNKRPDYVDAWWNTVNWAAVNEEFSKAKS
jgi:Fe-Mn family superoxide dismutase